MTERVCENLHLPGQTEFAEEEAGVLRFVRIAVGEGDPLGCASCTSRGTHSYHAAAVVEQAIASAVDAWPGATPGPNLLLTGPEPFAHPELPRLVGMCVEAGAQRVGIETDGAALSMPNNVSGVLSAGVRHLHIRLLDADEERGDRIGGSPGRTKHALLGVEAFLATAASAGVTVAVTAVVPVCRHNLGALPDTVLQAARLGIHAVRLVPGGELPASSAAVLAAACDTGMVNAMWVEADPLLPLPDTHLLHAVSEGSDG